MNADNPTWHLNPLLKLHWRDWGGDAVVLESTSGQTHQLDRLSAAVVIAFQESPATVQSLSTRLAADLLDIDSTQLQASLLPIIERLALMGWLRPAAP